MPRSASTGQARVFGLSHRRTVVRVLVEDGDGTMRDLSDEAGRDWVKSAEWGEDIDDQVMTARVALIRDFYGYSLARDVEGSRLNRNAAGSYDPLLEVGRSIVIETAVIPQDAEPVSGDWVEVFDGIIDFIDWAKPTVEIQARESRAAQLQDLWIEDGDAVYGATPPGSAVETEMQAILDDWGPQRPSIGDTAINLYTPTSPSWNILEYHQEQMPVLQALQNLAAQIGWVCRTIWDNGTSAWRLTFMEPDRAKSTPDLTYTADDYVEVTRCAVELASIRNVVEVVYTDSTVSEATPDDTSGRRTVTSSDSTSITAYGRRWMQIAEASTSNINTSTEATALADAALADLQEPKVSFVVRQKFDWRIQLGDLLRYEANDKHFGTDRDLAVVGYRHRVDGGAGRTEVTARGQPAAYYDTWLEAFMAHTGSGLTADTGGPGAITPTLSADAAGTMTLNMPYPDDDDFDQFEIHRSASALFTPDSTTLVGRTRSRAHTMPGPPGETAYVQVIGIDRYGNRSSPSSEVSAAFGRAGPQLLSADANWGGRFLGEGFGVQTRGNLYPPDMWNMRSGVWGTDATVSTTVRLTGDYSLHLIQGQSAELMSDLIPIRTETPYAVTVEWQHEIDAGAGGADFTCEIEWYSNKGSLISTDTIVDDSAAAADTWQTDTGRFNAPATARWARLVVTADTSSGDCYIDRVELKKILPAFSAYLSSGHTVTDNTWSKVQNDTEVFDLGLHFDVGNSRFICPEQGLYSFSAGVLFDVVDEYAHVAIAVNGTARYTNGGDVAISDGSEVRVSVSVESALFERGDIIEVYVRAGSSGTPEVDGGTVADTWFTGRQVY